MSVPPEQFSRVAGRVNLRLLATKFVVIVGVGTVGSLVARELAYSGVGRLLLIDGEPLEESNLARHYLDEQDNVRMNKAEGVSVKLDANVPGLRVEAFPWHVDETISDDQLDDLLRDADVVVIATDHRVPQRRVAQRALALDMPAVLPGLYADGGGEVFVQLGRRAPCFFCWDGFRPEGEQLRGVTALNAEGFAIIQLTVELIHGSLDRASPFAEYMRRGPGATDGPHQAFVQFPRAALATPPVEALPNCPSCAVAPSPITALDQLRDSSVLPNPVPSRRSGATSPPSTAAPVRSIYEQPGGAFALFLLALLFAAGPGLVLLPLGGEDYINEDSQSLIHGLLDIVIGWGSFAWLLAGLAGVVLAGINLLVSFGRGSS